MVAIEPGAWRVGLGRNGRQVDLKPAPNRKRFTMKKAARTKSVKRDPPNGDAIAAYAQAQLPAFRAMCNLLRQLIDSALPKASSKVWHGSPVWFTDDNPVVGYNAAAKTVNLLFWNGRAFDEPDLQPVGKYQAAQAMFRDVAEIDAKTIRRWLKKARSDVFDSRAFFKKLREGR